MRLFPEEVLILHLVGKLPDTLQHGAVRQMTPQECLRHLRELTELDLGDDPLAWERWMSKRKARRQNSDAGVLIARLQGTAPPGGEYDWLQEMTPKECLEDLRRIAGRDLGKSPEAWLRWWYKKIPKIDLDNAFDNHTVFPEELLLRRLAGTLHAGQEFAFMHTLTPDECYKELRQRSGEDFGTDLAAWQQWWRQARVQYYLESAELLPPYTRGPEELLILRLEGIVPPGEHFDWLREMTEAECLRALRELTGQDLGSDPRRWAAWWQSEQE